MKFIEKIKQLSEKQNNKIKVLFFLSSFFYILLTYIFFIYNIGGNDFFYKNLTFLSDLTKELETNFNEKNLEIILKDNTFNLNQPEPVLLPLNNKSISSKKNLLYISSTAEDRDFTEKDVLMILNKNELKFYTGNEPIAYPITNIQSIQDKFNKETLSYINSTFFPGSSYFNNLGLNFIAVFKIVEVAIYFLVVLKVIPLMVYGILWLSGYKNTDSKKYIDCSLIIFSIYLIIKLPLNTFIIELPTLSSLLLISVIVSILEKSKIEKN